MPDGVYLLHQYQLLSSISTPISIFTVIGFTGLDAKIHQCRILHWIYLVNFILFDYHLVMEFAAGNGPQLLRKDIIFTKPFQTKMVQQFR